MKVRMITIVKQSWVCDDFPPTTSPFGLVCKTTASDGGWERFMSHTGGWGGARRIYEPTFISRKEKKGGQNDIR